MYGIIKLQKSLNNKTINQFYNLTWVKKKPLTLVLGGSSTNDIWVSSELRCSTHYRRKNFPFNIVVRESENNVEHLRFRGAPTGIFLPRHNTFGISRVHSLCGPESPFQTVSESRGRGNARVTSWWTDKRKNNLVSTI